MSHTPFDWAKDPSIFLSSVVALGAFAQWIAWQFRLPSILLLLAFGFGARMLTGVDPVEVLGEDCLCARLAVCGSHFVRRRTVAETGRDPRIEDRRHPSGYHWCPRDMGPGHDLRWLDA